MINCFVLAGLCQWKRISEKSNCCT